MEQSPPCSSFEKGTSSLCLRTCPVLSGGLVLIWALPSAKDLVCTGWSLHVHTSVLCPSGAKGRICQGAPDLS